MATKQKRPKAVIFMTPPGTAVFPYLNEPDRGQYAKNKEFGNWKTGLRLSLAEPAVKEFVAKLEAAYVANLAQVEAEETPKDRAERMEANRSLGATRPYKNEFAEDGSPTGFVVVNFKRGAGGRDEKDPTRTWVTPIGLFDSANKKIDRSRVRIGGGSRIIVGYELTTFATQIGAGVSLRLHAVQVLERMDAPEKDAAQYGFQAQAGGFVDDTGDEPEETESAPTGAADDDTV